MADTLCVVALDAADYELVRRWDCSNILLDHCSSIDTFTFNEDTPLTLEVWPTVATGEHPKNHGLYDGAQEWDNPLLRIGSLFTQYFPNTWRQRLGRPFRRRGFDLTVDQVQTSHLFETGAAFGWPGIASTEHLRQTWQWMSQIKRGEVVESDISIEILGNFGQEVGWLLGVSRMDVPIAGAHSHILDFAGHSFASRKERLQDYYEHVDDLIYQLRQQSERLVVLSDHGMQVSWLDDPSPGEHSNRALVAASSDVSGELPASVFDVRGWLEPQIQSPTTPPELASIDTPREQLENLGYME